MSQITHSSVHLVFIKLLLTLSVFKLREQSHFFLLHGLDLLDHASQLLLQVQKLALSLTSFFSISLDKFLQLRAVLLSKSVQRIANLAKRR